VFSSAEKAEFGRGSIGKLEFNRLSCCQQRNSLVEAILVLRERPQNERALSAVVCTASFTYE
jgi:hypothetical protein